MAIRVQDSPANPQHTSVVGKIQQSCLWVVDKIAPRNCVTKQRQVFSVIPESIEIGLGSWLYPQMINSQGGEYLRHGFNNDVDRIGTRLCAHSDRPNLPYQFKVIDSNILNAWCLPGGKIAFYKGLILKMDQEMSDFGLGAHFTLEDKIAGVMSHEITHAAARHSARSLEFGAFITGVLLTSQAFLKIFIRNSEETLRNNPEHPEARNLQLNVRIARIIDSVFNVFYDSIYHLITSCAGRHKELEADKYGMVLLKRSGYDPRVGIWVQEFFAKQHPKTHIGWVDYITHIISSHPHAEDRAAINRKTLEEINSGLLT